MKKLKIGKWFLIWGCGHLATKTIWNLVESKLGNGTKSGILKIARAEQADGLVRFDVFIREERVDNVVCKLRLLFPNARIREHRPYHLRTLPENSDMGKTTGAAKDWSDQYRFLSININSLTGNKKVNLIHWALRDRVSVLAIQEHMRSANDDGGSIRLSGYTVFSAPADPALEGVRGVALAVRMGIPCFERRISHYYVLIHVVLNGRKILVGSVYVPTIRRIQSQVLKDLAYIIRHERSKVDDVILLGDFNINRQKIQAKCDMAKLKVKLCEVDGPPETWHRVPSRRMTAIDHVLRCPDSALEASKAVVDRTWDLSDHFAIYTDVKLPGVSLKATPPVEEQVAIDKRKLKKVAEQIRNNNRFGALLDLVDDDEMSADACEEAASGFVKESHNTIKELCARKPAKSKYKGRLSVEAIGLLKKRSEQYGKLIETAVAVRDMDEPSAEVLEEHDVAHGLYLSLAEQADVILKEERSKNFQDYVKEAMDYLSNRHYREFYAWCNQLSGRKGVNKPKTAPIKDESGVLRLHPDEILEVWAQTYRKLYSDVSGNSKNADPWKVTLPIAGDKPVLPDLDLPVTWKEVHGVIRQMKGSKAPGGSNLTTEWLKVAIEGESSDQATPKNDMAKCIVKIVSSMVSQATVPKCLSLSLVVPIPKKGDPTETDNYRGISLMETLLKVACTLVNKRLTRAVEKANILRKEQAGFRQGEEGIAQVIALYEVTLRRRLAGKSTVVAFVDFRKAYDMVLHEALFRKLEHVGIRGKLLLFLRALYKESKLCVRLSCGKSAEVELQRGLRQGCPLSPLLFDLYINDIVDVLAEFGVEVPGVLHRVPCLLFADDLVILAESVSQLEEALAALGKWATTWEMEFGFKKCGVMIIHGDQQELVARKPKINGTEIPIVDQYTYLGVQVDTNFSLKAIVDARATAVQRAIGSASGFLKSRNIPAHIRLRALKSFILPVATFGGEILGMDKRNTAAIQRSMDVGISYVLTGKFNRSCGRATFYLESDIPPMYVLCSSARNRLFLKSRSLKTWIRTLAENPVVYKGGGQGGRAWIGKTEFWLKRFGPRDIAPAGQDTNALRFSRLRSFLWGVWNDSARVKNTSSMMAYSERKLEASCGYLCEVTYSDQVIRGVSHLTTMRLGAYWTGEALAKAGRIPETYLNRCPCCGEEEAETISHILVSCQSWRKERMRMMMTVKRCLRKLKLEYRWLYKDLIEEDLATLLLGGAVVDSGRTWEPFWSSGVARILGKTFSGGPAAIVEDEKKWSQKPLFFYVAIFLDTIHVPRCSSVWAHQATTESRSPSDMAAQLGHVAAISDD